MQFFLKVRSLFSFPLGYPSRFLFPFLGQEPLSQNSFSSNGPTFHLSPWPYSSQEVSHNITTELGLGLRARGGGDSDSVSVTEDRGCFLESRTALTITVNIRVRNPGVYTAVRYSALWTLPIILPARKRKLKNFLIWWNHQNHLIQSFSLYQ